MLEISPAPNTAPGGGFMLRICPDSRLRAKFPDGEVPLGLSKAELSGVVEDCQTGWWYEVVECRALVPHLNLDTKSVVYTYFFHERAGRPVSEREYRKILSNLAKKGQELFIQVFRPAGSAYKATRNVGSVLCELMKEQDLSITIRSSGFFAPWNLMYLGDVGNVTESGFWGFQHLIEQDVSNESSDNAPFASNLRVAVHFDTNIDATPRLQRFHCIRSFKELLGEYNLNPSERNTRDEFEMGLRAGPTEHIFYFCCHARAGNLKVTRPELFLTNSQAITPVNIDTWLDKCQELPGRPLVFINACEAAKTGSIFYEGFASKFLNHYAAAVIGPELEMPVVFGHDFAIHFFNDFFRGGPENSVGKILLRLRRNYMITHWNPLGLVYSLYRGGDIFLEGPLPVLLRDVRNSCPSKLDK